MKRPAEFLRLLRIARVFARHGLDEFLSTLHLFRPLRPLLAPFRGRGARTRPRGVRLREALEELGPIFVKFGQMLSTRPDLLPEDIAAELAKLQDQVPPFPGAQARAVIEAAYGEPLTRYFTEFDEQPLASASVAQVHLARRLDGTEVVVKVLRPGIEPVIERDLGLLYTLARLAERYWSEGPRLRPVEVVGEYEKTIHDELDMRREAANASRLRANFEGSPLIYVPKVYWDETRRELMVMERIHGIPVRDITALKAAGIDMRKLAHDGVEIFFTQAFRDGYFHADMHPGNIFVSPEGQYRAVDFGIMGILSETDKRYLAENFLAFFHRDYRAVADAHLRAGWVPANTRSDEFEAAIRTVCEPVFARPISEISFGHFLVQLFQTARRFQMPIQPQLVLLQKTLLAIEGLGRQLYPHLDLWETAKPYLERWMAEQVGPKAFLNSLRAEFPGLARQLPEMPRLLHDWLKKHQDEDTAGHRQADELARLREELDRQQRRLYAGMLGGLLFLCAVLLHLFGGDSSWRWHGVPVVSWMLGFSGGVFMLASWPKSS